MAMDYEVRQQYKEMPLTELLDSTVMCFQGVGDIQHEILNKFFEVETVRDLANLSFFISSLGIQEQALKHESNGTRKVSDIAKSEPLKFQVRPEYLDETAKNLLASPVRVLDPLTPAQSLAFYDAFRVTNVIQLAQNRIMLEARIIEYLKKVESGEIPEADMNQQIASVLLSSTATLPDAAGERETGGDEGDLRSLTGGLALHLRERLETMRNRARSKATEISQRPTATSDERSEDAGRVRPTLKLDARNRLDAIRESRMRADSAAAGGLAGRSAADAVGSVVAARGSVMGEMRARRAGEAATTVVGRTLSRPGTGRGTASVTATRGSSSTATVTRGASSSSAAGTRPPAMSAAARAAQETAAKADQMAKDASATESRQREARRGPDPRALLIAAAVLLLLVGGIWFWISSREEPASMTAVSEQPAGGQQSPSPAESPSGQAATSESSAGGADALPVKSIHTVSWGQSLWRISRQYYANPEKWPWIFRANRDQIDNPDLIYPKQKFNIPDVK